MTVDASDAFCKVTHPAIDKGLQDLGLPEYLTGSISAWTKERWFRSRVGSDHSAWTKAFTGVAQGTVLGPVLYIIVADGLIKALDVEKNRIRVPINTNKEPKKVGCDGHGMYADDLALWVSTPVADKGAEAAGQWCSTAVQWMRDQGIPTSSKTQAVIFGASKKSLPVNQNQSAPRAAPAKTLPTPGGEADGDVETAGIRVRLTNALTEKGTVENIDIPLQCRDLELLGVTFGMRGEANAAAAEAKSKVEECVRVLSRLRYFLHPRQLRDLYFAHGLGKINHLFPVLWEWEPGPFPPPVETVSIMDMMNSIASRARAALLPAAQPQSPAPVQYVPNPAPTLAVVPHNSPIAALERAHASAARAICGTAATAATACCLREACLEPLQLIAHRHMMSIEEKMARSGAQTNRWVKTEGKPKLRRPLLDALPYDFPGLSPDASIAMAAELAQKVRFFTEPGTDGSGRKLTKLLGITSKNGVPVDNRDSSRDRRQAPRDEERERRWREEDLWDSHRAIQLPNEFEWGDEDDDPDPQAPAEGRRTWQPPTYTVKNQSVLAVDNDRRLAEAIRAGGPPEVQIWTDGAVKRLRGKQCTVAAGAADLYLKDSPVPLHSLAWPAGVDVCSYTAECVGAIEGLLWLLSEQGRSAFPTPGHLLWATDSRSLLQALEKGVLDQTDFMEAKIWSLLLDLIQRGWVISAVFVFSHVGTAKNESVDATAEGFLRNVEEPETVRRTRDGFWWKDNARRRHKAYEKKYWTTEGTPPALGSVAKSYGPKSHTVPFNSGLSAKGTCLLAQVRSGVCARAGILTEMPKDCPRCGARAVMGREARGVEHMFTCRGLNDAFGQYRESLFSEAILRKQEVTPKLLWSHPFESVQLIECFITGDYDQRVPEFEDMPGEQPLEGEFRFVDDPQIRE
jgi:ribonuclease HI